jgi:CubicO group peptidase (beta-lactamase class C family)
MPINFKAWHDQTAVQHTEKAEKFFKQGFRTVSLCVYGEPNDPRYAAVMVKRPNPADEKSFIALSIAEMQKKTNDLAKQGFGAAIISATGPASSPLVAAVFRPMMPLPLTSGNLTADDLLKANQQAWKDGNILKWADAYGTPDDTRYMAVWQPNTDNAAWNCDGVNDDVQTMQQRFNALVSGGGRAQHVAITPSQGFLQVFVDTDIGGWFSVGNMTSAGFQAKRDELEKQGFAPICVAAQGSGANTRFAAIFTTHEEITPRDFTITPSPTEEPSAPEIDAIIEAVMKKNRIRGAAVAIVKDTRLVYAKGYTWAEAGYPKVTPTTFFRQSSVSKVFASIATYQLIKEGKSVGGKNFSLDTTMQSVLKLKTPTGGKPTDANFDKITIRDLLEMTSGIDKGLVFRDVEATKAFNPPESLPAKPKHLAAFCASQKLSGEPGNKAIANYNNGGYFMLSQVIAAMRDANSFEEAIKASLLKPLGIKRVRETRSLVSAQPSDEARYHSTEECIAFDSKGNCTTRLFPRIRTSTSVMSPDQPLVALGYGDTNLENVDGAGGLSGAVTDVARLLAALSVRKNNPVLDDAMITTMLANAAAAVADKQLAKNSQGNTKAWGFHGFDNVVAMDAAKGIYMGVKGGSYWTSVNGIGFLRGGMAYVVCWNCTTPKEDGSWAFSFWDKINKHDWGNTDLFKKYGMSPFPASSGFSADAAAKPALKLPPLPKFNIGSIVPSSKPTKSK